MFFSPIDEHRVPRSLLFAATKTLISGPNAAGWSARKTKTGEVYYVNYSEKRTTWVRPVASNNVLLLPSPHAGVTTRERKRSYTTTFRRTRIASTKLHVFAR